MNLILKEIAVNRKVFIMLFIGFVLTILPILIAISIRDYYDEKFYDSKNGHFNYYYSIQLTSIGELSFNEIQELAEANFKNASVITNDINSKIPDVGHVTMIGLINNKGWSPPLIKGSSIELDEENSVIMGKRLYKDSETIQLFSREYTVKGVSGTNTGYGYDDKIFVSLNNMPDEIKRRIQNENIFQMIVRSNEDPEKEIGTFIQHVKQNNKNLNIKVVNEKENYEKEKNSSQALTEQLALPYRLIFIAVINCIIVSYFWIYTKRRSISLRKALGASSLDLFVFIFSQLFICAISAAICAICIQWVLSTLSKSIIHSIGFHISIDFFHIVMSVCISLLISFITSVIPFIQIINIEPAKALKE
ncbi:FtsX-like permease family protein [Bacillus mycoides]|uniref:ABC transporter permease n=1 Tax=Bacillus thuringiensis serovar navarrensis TaxID=339658 RepID=A0A243AIU8_BACTU|nr:MULTISPECIES: FtsX-like permease family protein [Bacillus cereus group]MED1268753.1 FtsX-like permease family protein [Bacillus mycoides]OTY22901.1 ABC transporter permease [Bacillus thuringiensis serovar navarrensis]